MLEQEIQKQIRDLEQTIPKRKKTFHKQDVDKVNWYKKSNDLENKYEKAKQEMKAIQKIKTLTLEIKINKEDRQVKISYNDLQDINKKGKEIKLEDYEPNKKDKLKIKIKEQDLLRDILINSKRIEEIENNKLSPLFKDLEKINTIKKTNFIKMWYEINN